MFGCGNAQLFFHRQFQRSHHSMARLPRTPFDGGALPPFRQASVIRQTLLIEDDAHAAIRLEQAYNMFNPFDGEDEWSIRATLQGFNKDKSKHSSSQPLLSAVNKVSIRPFFSLSLFAPPWHAEVQQTFGKIITEPEIRAFEVIAKNYFKDTRQRYLPQYWVPLQWAIRLVQKAGLHGNIQDPRMIGYMCKVSWLIIVFLFLFPSIPWGMRWSSQVLMY